MTPVKKKNKKFKSNKVIILLSAVFALVLCAAVLITYLVVSNRDNAENIENSENNASFSVAGTYKPYRAVETETGKEEPLGTVFGSAYGKYGGELTLNDDGSFSVYVGASNTDTGIGTYSFQDGIINASYDSGETAVFTLEADDSGAVTVIVPMGLYNIYFR